MNRSRFNILLALSFSCLVAPSLFAQVIERPVATLTLSMVGSSGTNGTAVAYNPTKDLYYTAIAGNKSFPLEAFNASGTNEYAGNCVYDVRGLWWNSKKKRLEGNGYSSEGIFYYNMSTAGLPSEGASSLFEGSDYQPTSNSVGDSDGKKLIYYINGDVVETYKMKDGSYGNSITLEISSDELEQLNTTTVIYTGIKGMELGVLNAQTAEVILFSKKSGKEAKRIALPDDAITSYSFRFSYANGHVFLYDTGSRSWTGYKIK